jgi:iron complex transport system permease protein
MTKRLLLLGGLCLLVLLLSGLSLTAGRVWVPWSAWSQRPRSALGDHLRAAAAPDHPGHRVGAALGLSGAVMQGYTRNPLADPGVLGVSSMAALGAVMTMYLSLSLTTPWLLFVAAMVGASIGVAVMLVLAGGTGGTITFILAGVILNTVASAGVALALSLAPSPWAAQEIINWLLGSLADRSADDVWRALPFIPSARA